MNLARVSAVLGITSTQQNFGHLVEALYEAHCVSAQTPVQSPCWKTWTRVKFCQICKHPAHSSRIRILRFFENQNKRDFLCFLKWHFKNVKNVIPTFLVSDFADFSLHGISIISKTTYVYNIYVFSSCVKDNISD